MMLMMMLICVKQHLSNAWSSIHDKVKQHWDWILKKALLIKQCVIWHCAYKGTDDTQMKKGSFLICWQNFSTLFKHFLFFFFIILLIFDFFIYSFFHWGFSAYLFFFSYSLFGSGFSWYFFLFHILVLTLDFSDISFLYSFFVQGFSGISFSGP